MRFTILLLLLLPSLVVGSQTKEQAFATYFIGIPVFDSFQKTLNFLETEQRFGIDSIQSNGRVFSSVKGILPFAEKGIEKIVVTVRQQVWEDSETKVNFDTSLEISVEYLFNKADKKGRDAFYKQVYKNFVRHYAYNDELDLPGKYHALLTRFTNIRFANFSELSLYKGFAMGEFNYVTIRYDKRKHYKVKEPDIFIQKSPF